MTAYLDEVGHRDLPGGIEEGRDGPADVDLDQVRGRVGELDLAPNGVDRCAEQFHEVIDIGVQRHVEDAVRL
ncbi:MAG TPA: hypothetical protein VHW74_10185 [Mycobacteriales bacterium]|jgi:hypothetical protein|nr:hypothetical protein [Mycobacteriales bacterium]